MARDHLTPNHSREPRCLTCVYACHIRGYAESQQQTVCTAHGWGDSRPIPFPVYECSMYELKGRLSLHQMENMAHIIERKPDGGIGFIPPKRRDNYD